MPVIIGEYVDRFVYNPQTLSWGFITIPTYFEAKSGQSTYTQFFPLNALQPVLYDCNWKSYATGNTDPVTGLPIYALPQFTPELPNPVIWGWIAVKDSALEDPFWLTEFRCGGVGHCEIDHIVWHVDSTLNSVVPTKVEYNNYAQTGQTPCTDSTWVDLPSGITAYKTKSVPDLSTGRFETQSVHIVS